MSYSIIEMMRNFNNMKWPNGIVARMGGVIILNLPGIRDVRGAPKGHGSDAGDFDVTQ